MEMGGRLLPDLPRYNSPLVQVTLLGMVCFCCPGMFNALTGMGGGGQLDPSAADSANTALYATFTLFGVVGGSIHNLLRPRLSLLLGSLPYLLYSASFLLYNHNQNPSFPVAAGAILGAGAGLLWAAQGAVMTSYPPPHRRGSFISLFWVLFNLGGVLGGLLPFSLNYHRSATSSSVSDSTYIAFMCFMSLGSLLSLAILPPSGVVRDDGSRPTSVRYPRASDEARALVKLFGDWRMLLVAPAAWASNFFYTYQFNNVNGRLFNLRTRGFNNIFYWGSQMVGSVALGYLLDHASESRRRRGMIGIAVVTVVGSAVWGGGLANQMRYLDGSSKEESELLDFKDSGWSYAGPFLLYFSYGLLDAMFQTLVYWIIGALGDDSELLSRYSGFYKSVQSLGAAVAWQIDRRKTPVLTQLIINWCLTTISYPSLAILVALAVKEEEQSTKIQVS